MIDDLLNNDRHLYLYDLLNHNLNLNNLWYLDDSFNDLFDDSGDLHYLFSILEHLNNLFNNVVNVSDDFNRNVNYPFNLLNLDHLNDFFSNSLDCNDLRHFDHSFDNLLNDLLHFNDFGDDSEHLKNVINVNNSHYFLIDHTDYTFIDIQNNSSSTFDLLQLLKQGFDKDSKVELYFSAFFTAVCIDILNTVEFRDILDNRHESFEVIRLKHINNFLLEELSQSAIAFLS
jgi:hypothetical protein